MSRMPRRPASIGALLTDIISFDTPVPLEVDDECWDLSNLAEWYPLREQQPEGRPSYISYFIQHARLTVILGTATRTIVCGLAPRMPTSIID